MKVVNINVEKQKPHVLSAVLTDGYIDFIISDRPHEIKQAKFPSKNFNFLPKKQVLMNYQLL